MQEVVNAKKLRKGDEASSIDGEVGGTVVYTSVAGEVMSVKFVKDHQSVMWSGSLTDKFTRKRR